MSDPSPARRGTTVERVAFACFVVATLAALGLAGVYAAGGQPQAEGTLLGIALLGFGAGLILWAHALMPQGPFVEERHPLATTPEEREAFEDALEREGTLTRRRLLLGGMTGALVALGVAFLFPIRSLGPSPGRTLEQTPWRKGLRAITDDGRPVRASEVPLDGLVDDLPGGPSRFRRRPGRAHARRPRRVWTCPPGRETWTPNGLIAYSKVCTHAGCPVGLYEAQRAQLLCPCHQSAFDVLDGREPRVRSGRPRPPAASARGRRRGIRDRAVRLHRADRAVVLEPPVSRRTRAPCLRRRVGHRPARSRLWLRQLDRRSEGFGSAPHRGRVVVDVRPRRRRLRHRRRLHPVRVDAGPSARRRGVTPPRQRVHLDRRRVRSRVDPRRARRRHGRRRPRRCASRARDELRIDVTGERWWWGCTYHGAGIESAERDPPPGRPADRHPPHLRQRDPQLLGAAARGEGRRDPGTGQPPALHAPTTSARTAASAPSSAASSTRTCRSVVHVLTPGDFGRWLARQRTAAGRARVRVDRERSGRVPARGVRRLPHRRTAPSASGDDRSRPHRRRRAHDARRGRDREQHRATSNGGSATRRRSSRAS